MPFIIPEKWLSTSEVAEMLSVTSRTVEHWRNIDKGPTYVKLGGSIKYREEDVLAWLAANIVQPGKCKEESAA